MQLHGRISKQGCQLASITPSCPQCLKDTSYPVETMGITYRVFSKPFLAIQDSEKAHGRALMYLSKFSNSNLIRPILELVYKPNKSVEISAFGLDFKNPFGLAAGMDKKAEALNGWASLGCGFIEIGGITMLKQRGNPKPRMFRDNSTRSLVNRMGFNNIGSLEMKLKLKQHYEKHGKPETPVFANIGKSKATPLDDASLDYCTTIERLSDYVDGFVVNVSSPNTPNLRDLQESSALDNLLKEIQSTNLRCKKLPILIKIAPDLSDDQIIAIVDTAKSNECAGIVLCNTTLSREVKKESKNPQIMEEKGGLSGSPLKERSTEIISLVAKHTEFRWPIIGVGGIMNSEDAWEKIISGAWLIQAYSGFVFEGPGIVKEIVHGLDKKLVSNGFKTLEQAVGSAHKE